MRGIKVFVSRIDPSIRVKSTEPFKLSRFEARPVEKLSMATTWCPSETSRSDKWDPINPAPPVIRIRIREV
jgi:hypothetical protein